METNIERIDSFGYESRNPPLFDNQIEELLTVREVAELMKLSEKTIRNWVFDGVIPTVRPRPRIVRFSKQAIGKWLSKRRETV